MKIEIYRALKLNDANYPQLEKMGICWTTDFRKAFPYGYKQVIDFYYIYTGLIEQECINQEATNNCLFTYEREVVLFENSIINMTSIELIKIQPVQKIEDDWIFSTVNSRKNVRYVSKA